MEPKTPKLVDISGRHKRCRQQSLVDILKRLTERADSGEVVGAVVVYITNENLFKTVRDLQTSEIDRAIAMMEMAKIDMVHEYLTGDRLAAPDNSNDQEDG